MPIESHPLPSRRQRPMWAVVVLVLSACTGTIGDKEPDPSAPGRGPFQPLVAGLRTLTPEQYAASVREVLDLELGDPIVEPVGQWDTSIGAARGGLSPATVETYEAASRRVMRALFEDEARRDALLGCDPGPACSREVVARLGRRAFRRSLTDAELDRWAGLADRLAADLGDPHRGLELALGGLLQSPHFLYRAELGEEEGEGFVYGDHEMATRLAFLVWNQTPDDALLDVADAGGLSTAADVEAQVERMLEDPRADAGLRGFLAEMFAVADLHHLDKDPREFPDFDPALGPAMAEQMVLTAEAALREGGYPAVFTTRDTVANDALAALMGLDATGFGSDLVPVSLAADGPRAGILTMPGYLAMHAYPGKTSPSLRGLFVRQRLLCQSIPPPPAGVSTVLPEQPDGELVTTRELVAFHQQNPSCASCHSLMDPIGLGLERFDAVGAHRLTENMLDIDPSGELEGVAFDDAVGLGEAVSRHPRLLPCFMATLYAFGAANTVPTDAPTIEQMVAAGDADSVARAITAIATSDIFRQAHSRRGDSP